MTRSPRHYTNATKAKAVGLASVTTQEQAAAALGIPKRTLSDWMHDPEYAAMRDMARDKVAESMWIGVQVGISELVNAIRQDAPLRDKAIAFGILYDKYALLTGAATARTESRDLTGTLSDAELIDALHEAQRLATGGGTTGEGESATEGG